MEAYLDTNVILDAMLERSAFSNPAKEIFYNLASSQITGIISTSAITDIYYLIQKNTDRSTAKKAIETLFNLMYISDTTREDCINAYSLEMKDFEDALVVSVAKRNKVDCIITRNVKDFTNAPLPVLTPEEFLENLNPIT